MKADHEGPLWSISDPSVCPDLRWRSLGLHASLPAALSWQWGELEHKVPGTCDLLQAKQV